MFSLVFLVLSSVRYRYVCMYCFCHTSAVIMPVSSLRILLLLSSFLVLQSVLTGPTRYKPGFRRFPISILLYIIHVFVLFCICFLVFWRFFVFCFVFLETLLKIKLNFQDIIIIHMTNVYISHIVFVNEVRSVHIKSLMPL